MDLLWVRHAEPERVAGGTGVPANPSLTARGRDQADRIARWLALEPIDVVLTSPQARAIETATPIARAHDLTPVVLDGLVEYDVQADDYIPMEELRESNSQRLQDMIAGNWENFGAESTDVFRARVAKTIDEIVDGYPGRRVVAVCHGGVINVALAVVLGLDQWLWFDPRYTSLSRMKASRAGVRTIVSINEHAHLEATREKVE